MSCNRVSIKLPVPHIHAYDARFRYVHSTQTDIRKTFARHGWHPPVRDWAAIRAALNRSDDA